MSAETKAGRRPLRRIAKACEGAGQRVQKSVFECQIDLTQMEALERRLLAEIDSELDCLRLYRLSDAKGCEDGEHGKFKVMDYADTGLQARGRAALAGSVWIEACQRGAAAGGDLTLAPAGASAGGSQRCSAASGGRVLRHHPGFSRSPE